ncbi:hypothetical protein MC885_002169 [Smutsia gigantea]|nr:hypothetical protein MC885_002169 [Smutsia gigantea]
MPFRHCHAVQGTTSTPTALNQRAVQVFERLSGILKHFPGIPTRLYSNTEEPDDFDTTVYPILSSVFHDPHHFEMPDTFHPGHFLDAEGNFRKQEAFTPFSRGQPSPSPPFENTHSLPCLCVTVSLCPSLNKITF